MKYWVMTLLHLWGRMDGLSARIESELDELSCDLKMDTIRLFERVLALHDRRMRVTNFKAVGGMLREALTDSEWQLIARRARGETFLEMGAATGVSKATASRRFLAAVQKCAVLLRKLTFTQERLEKDYRDVPLIYRTQERLRKSG